MASSQLPLGAIETEDGQVIIPSSRRADGSMRKPIRIRKGFRPQEEVPTYKTPAQRRREQEEKTRRETTAPRNAAAAMGSTDASPSKTVSRAGNRTTVEKKLSSRQDRAGGLYQPPPARRNPQQLQQRNQLQRQLPNAKQPRDRVASNSSDRNVAAEVDLVDSMQKLKVEEPSVAPVNKKDESTTAKAATDVRSQANTAPQVEMETTASGSSVPPPAPASADRTTAPALSSRENKPQTSSTVISQQSSGESPRLHPFKSGIFPNGIP